VTETDLDEKDLLEADGLHVEVEPAEVEEIPVDEQPTNWSPDVSARPPTIFDDRERPDDVPPPVDYQDYVAGETFVISGPLGTSKFPGRRFASRAAAKLHVQRTYGRIYQWFNIPGRWAGRVKKPARSY